MRCTLFVGILATCMQGCGVFIERNQPIVDVVTSERSITVCGANEKQREIIRSAIEGCCIEMQQAPDEIAIVTRNTTHLDFDAVAHCHRRRPYICIRYTEVDRATLWHEFTHARWHVVTPQSRMKLRKLFKNYQFGKNVLPQGVDYPCAGMASAYGQISFEENWSEWVELFLQIAHHEITLPASLEHNTDPLVLKLVTYAVEEGYLSKAQHDEVLRLMQ